MRILAISPFQNSSVAIFNDGIVELFCKEEEFTNIKNDAYPFLAIDFCVKNAAGSIDIALICSDTPSSNTIASLGAYVKKMYNIKEVIDISENYHLQLASLAFYNSQFDKALVVVVDDTGSTVEMYGRESETMFLAEYPANFKTMYQNIRLFDNAPSFQGERDGAYVDGVAQVGVSQVFTSAGNVCQSPLSLQQIVDLSAYGRADVNFTDLYKLRNLPNSGLFHTDQTTNNVSYLKYKNNKVSEITKDNYAEFADFAFQMQIQTQTAIAEMISIALKETNIKKVCIAGNFSTNHVANAFYKKRFPDVEFYIEPLYYGNAIGGAYFVYRDQTQDSRLYQNTKIKVEIPEELQLLDTAYCQLKDISKLISNNKIVGIFDNSISLSNTPFGNRNIVVNACDLFAKDKLQNVSHSLWFQTFGAIMLKEDAIDLFNITETSVVYNSYKLYTVRPSKKELIPSLVHADNTCRILIIDDESSFMFKMLKELKKLTGIGAVLTTELVSSNKIIVSTVADAVECFDTLDLDALWFPAVSKIKTKN